MKLSSRRLFIAWLAALCFCASPLRAQDPVPLDTTLAPPPDSLFAPLRGDPRELHFALRVALPEDQRTIAEVAVGHYYGIYRWALPGNVGFMQLDIGGGIFPRFNFSQNHDIQVIDFYGNLPLDVRIGKWAGRFMFYHVSSHLGDDYIRDNNLTNTESNSWNSVRSIISYDVSSFLRLYGGYTCNILAYPVSQEHSAYQAGTEIYFKPFAQGRAQTYWANDLQWWERTNFKTQFNSQLGIKTGKDATQGRGISYFLEFTTGPEYYGQFFTSQETRIGLGVKFDISGS